MKRAIKILAFLSLLLFILIVVLILFSPYFLSAYKDEISKYLGEALHRKVEISKISITLLNGLGLSVEGLTIHNQPGFKNDLFLKIDSFNLSMDFWPLLQQKVESHEITIHHPQLFLETNLKGVSNLETLGENEGTTSKPAAPFKPDVFPGIKISKLQIINGSVSDENNITQDAVFLDGMDINLPQLSYSPENGQSALLDRIHVEGGVKLARGKVNRFHFENLNGKVSLEKMNLLLKNWTLNSYGGTLSGSLDLNLKEKAPRYHFIGKAENLNLQALLNENISLQNLMTGRFYSNLVVDGVGLNLSDLEKNLSGKGNFLIQNGALKSVNLLKQISILSILPIPQKNDRLNETQIDSLKGDLLISHGKVFFQSLKGMIPEAEVMGDGTIDFHQKVDFKLRIVLNKDETGRLPREAKPYLLDNNERASFPITLQGNISSPSVRLETSEIRQKMIQKGVREGISSLLDRFSPK